MPVSASMVNSGEEVQEPRLTTKSSENREKAISCLESFFAKKKMYFGGKIPASILNTETHISWVMTTDMFGGIGVAYEIIEDYNDTVDNPIDETKLVLPLLHECHALGIPKPWIAGIVLVYLEICMGLTVDF